MGGRRRPPRSSSAAWARMRPRLGCCTCRQFWLSPALDLWEHRWSMEHCNSKAPWEQHRPPPPRTQQGGSSQCSRRVRRGWAPGREESCSARPTPQPMTHALIIRKQHVQPLRGRWLPTSGSAAASGPQGRQQPDACSWEANKVAQCSVGMPIATHTRTCTDGCGPTRCDAWKARLVVCRADAQAEEPQAAAH